MMRLSEIHRVVDWSKGDKDDYLMAMESSPVKDIEIKHVLRNALTDKIDDREMYMKGIDHSCDSSGNFREQWLAEYPARPDTLQ